MYLRYLPITVAFSESMADGPNIGLMGELESIVLDTRVYLLVKFFRRFLSLLNLALFSSHQYYNPSTQFNLPITSPPHKRRMNFSIMNDLQNNNKGIMSIKGNSRSSLPTISNPQLSYSQRYEHMTKLANYNEMTENQIWKEYEKLRACLKQLNEEVLYHMEKKAYANLGKTQRVKESKDLEGTLVLLDDQKKTNDTRLQNYNNQHSRLDERIKFLASKPNLFDDLNRQSDTLRSRIKTTKKENKDLKRNAQLQGRDLVNNTSILDKIMIEEQKLTRIFKQHKKHEETIKILNEKIDKFKEKISELQKAIDLRVEQFSRQENFIVEEIHFEHYEELKKQRDAIGKYEPIYKRNYLMKLKDLDTLVNSLTKHEKIIHDTQGNILNVRTEIQSISTLVGAQRKRFYSSVASKKLERSSREKPSLVSLENEQGNSENSIPILLTNPITNDKNQERL